MLDIRIGKKFPITQDRRSITYSRTPSKDRGTDSHGELTTGRHQNSSSRKSLKTEKSDKRLSTPKIHINDKTDLELGTNLSLKYKQL